MIELYKGDFRDKMSLIEDESLDAIITDIPYNISRDSGFSSMGRKGLDFGEWDKGFQEEDLKVLVPKLKKGGSFFCFHAFEQFSLVKEALGDLECKDRVIWRKSNAMPRNRDRRYVVNIEMASWYVKKGSPWTFNRQNDTYDESVLTYPVVPGKGRIHPTEKPLELMEEIVLRHTKEGDVVLDPFLGSGTTGLACVLLGRNFLGIERENDYFEKASSRIIRESPLNRKKEIKIFH